MISEQTRKKMRESHLGKPGWWAGKKRPGLSLKLKGIKRSLETREKISNFQKGRKRKPHSQDTKNKIAKRLIGNKNTFGKKYGKETRDKHKKFMLGTHPSEETLEKKRQYMLGRMAGDKHYNWKGGITTQNNKIRQSVEMRDWIKSVFERDRFTCQKYGITGGYLHAHHIENFADNPDLRLAIDNGITLSKKAHREFHKKYGNKNNTKKQLIEFLQS